MSHTIPNSVTVSLARPQDVPISQRTTPVTRNLNLAMPPSNLSAEEIVARIDDYYILVRNTSCRAGWSVAQGIMSIGPYLNDKSDVSFMFRNKYF